MSAFVSVPNSILYYVIAGYLPVAVLLLLMLVLPFLFQVLQGASGHHVADCRLLLLLSSPS